MLLLANSTGELQVGEAPSKAATSCYNQQDHASANLELEEGRQASNEPCPRTETVGHEVLARQNPGGQCRYEARLQVQETQNTFTSL